MDEEVAGSEPMTDAQRIYLDALAGQIGEPTPGNNLTKTEADQIISTMRAKAGIGETDQEPKPTTGMTGKISADDDYDNRPDMTTDNNDDDLLRL